MKTILYLSPHLDDAVFSCSGHIKAEIDSGNRAIVATVFTKGDHVHRKKEDLRALKKCGAEHIWLEELDAPFREIFYNSFERIIFGDTKNFTISLVSLIQTVKPDQVIVPLAVGTHIDHRIVFDAATRLMDIDLLFYADRPYSLIQGATELRLNTLGYRATLPPFRDFWESYLDAPYVKTFLTCDLELVKNRLQKIYKLSERNLDYKLISTHPPNKESILCYESQIDAFISEDALTSEEALYWIS